jgi:hypothetical protein
MKKMTNSHNYSFFGQSTGMFLQSPSKEEAFIFFQFIKKKQNNTWEKPSLREGKRIKCGLEGMVMILQVLESKKKAWSTVHVFKEEKTPISVKWEGETKLWFNVGDYPKMLSLSQIEILRRLMEHILQEKIEFATSGNSNIKKLDSSTNTPESVAPKKEPLETQLPVIEEVDLGDGIAKISGFIKGETERALRIDITNGTESWFPKSVIKSSFDPEGKDEQSFLVDSWFLEKNNIAKV